MKEQFIFFWEGPFSQWHRSKFTIDGVEFNTAEQWMMYSKAKLFGDDETAKAILKTKNPKEQKALGRKVKNFNVGDWEKVARDIVFQGNVAKFDQNPQLRKLILATKDAGSFVEASPYDTIWGIGLRSDDPKALNRDTWRGSNWLGETLDKVRDELVKKHGV